MVMKIYGATNTGNCMRAILPLFEAGVNVDEEVKLVLVDLDKGDQKKDQYLTKNPLGRLPCLEDGDLILFESWAIARYLTEKYQLVPLLGSTLKERATIHQWCEVEGQNFMPAVAPIFKEVSLAKLEEREVKDKIINPCLAKVKAVLDIYEAQLAKNKYIAGEEYTLADAFHIPYLYKLTVFKKEVFLGRKHVLAWAENLINRPVFQKTLKTDAMWSKE